MTSIDRIEEIVGGDPGWETLLALLADEAGPDADRDQLRRYAGMWLLGQVWEDVQLAASDTEFGHDERDRILRVYRQWGEHNAQTPATRASA